MKIYVNKLKIGDYKDIRAIILDIDGVLTDGTFGYGETSEIKFFNTLDGTAVVAAKRLGYIVGAISGRSCTANNRRAQELHFDFLYEGIGTKIVTFEKVLKDFHLRPAECLYMGDDVQDIAIIKIAGIGILTANAPDYLKKYADYVTQNKGGRGAVREAVEKLFKETGQMDKFLALYGI